MSYNFFSFFFTHLTQKYSGAGLSSWVNIVQDGLTNERNEGGFNNLLLNLSSDLVGDFADPENLARAIALANNSTTIPSTADQGTLEITSARATSKFDTSFAVTVDKSLKIDSTLQPINNFSLLWNTPIYEGKLHSTADYVWREDTLSLDYPYEPSASDGQLRIMPWNLSNPDALPSNDEVEQVPTWLSITVDNSMLVSTTTVVDAYNPTRRIDSSTTTLYALVELLKSDFESTLDEAYQLRVDSLPSFLEGFFVTLKKQGLIHSKTWKNWSPRGYVPASTLGDVMNGCNLEEIALGIEALIELDDEFLLYLVLSELTYIWAKFLGNINDTTPLTFNKDAVPGFPSRLFRLFEDAPDFCFTPKSRDIRQNSLLGIALVDAATYFSDRTLNKYVGIPYLKEVIDQLGVLVASSVDLNGYVLAGYDEYGYSLDQYSYEASFQSSIFLNKLLTVSYNQSVHSAAARMHLTLSSFVSLEQLPGYNLLTFKQIANVDLAYAWWLSYFNKQTNLIEGICNNYQSALLQENNTFIETAWASVLFNGFKTLGVLPTTYDISNWSIANNYTYYDVGLYGTVVPELVSSSAAVLINNSFVFNSPLFDLHADETSAGVDYGFQSAQRLLPYGAYWHNKESEDKNTGEIGALIYSYATQSFDDILLTSLLKRGTSLNVAQGIVLSVLASSYGYNRLPLQSDLYVRQAAKKVVSLNTSVLTDIEEWILQTYNVPITVLTPVIPTSFYTLSNNVYTLHTPSSVKEAFSLIKQTNEFGADVSGYYQLVGSTYMFTSWESIRATITLKLAEFLPNLDESIQQLKTAGIKAKLELHLASLISSRLHTKATL